MQPGEQVIRGWFEEFWNQGRLDAIDRYMVDDYETRGLADHHGAPHQRETMRAFRQKFAEEFPTLRIDVQDVIVDGDRVAARCKVDVTQAGTGKQAQFGGMCFVHLKDGKIARSWNHFDFSGLRKQLA
jgi:predicted ester cyclase